MQYNKIIKKTIEWGHNTFRTSWEFMYLLTFPNSLYSIVVEISLLINGENDYFASTKRVKIFSANQVGGNKFICCNNRNCSNNYSCRRNKLFSPFLFVRVIRTSPSQHEASISWSKEHISLMNLSVCARNILLFDEPITSDFRWQSSNQTVFHWNPIEGRKINHVAILWVPKA